MDPSAYYLCTSQAGLAQDDASDAQWFEVTKLPPLAFDHKLLVRESFRHLAKQEELQKQGELASLHQICMADWGASGMIENGFGPTFLYSTNAFAARLT